jgi:predicted transcriptional regulator
MVPHGSTLPILAFERTIVFECIKRGKREIEDGKTLTHDEVESRLAKWLR